ncbi:protein lifeguard 3-like [Myxocyprinus asiaticus]|uniref:protein lifeguard 3-like n=1 Tax=Myxocyprinus asiaticus TaxID=70543 RepID=UPI0022238D8B|nr:protein lifeguard 3-like [Myxocyprinus asiaticus]
MMLSFITPEMFSSNLRDTDGISSPSIWDSMSVRHAFIRKVYLILAAQLFVTASVISVFAFVEPVHLFVIQNPAIYWASFPMYLVTYLVLVCCEGPRKHHSWNLALLLIFTLALSFMTGTISSYFDIKAVFLALGITAIVCVIVTIFCFQTKVPWLHMLYCGIIVFTMFLAYLTQLLIGNRANTISPEEYVFGALSLYMDIVQIFIFLLHITRSSSE